MAKQKMNGQTSFSDLSNRALVRLRPCDLLRRTLDSDRLVKKLCALELTLIQIKFDCIYTKSCTILFSRTVDRAPVFYWRSIEGPLPLQLTRYRSIHMS